MKKVISVLLALVMMFSLMNVAFATAEDPAAEDTTVAASEDDIIGEIEDIPLWQIKVGAKVGVIFAKVALKIVMVLSKLGFIDLSGVVDQLVEYIKGAINPQPEVPESTTATTEAVIA